MNLLQKLTAALIIAAPMTAFAGGSADHAHKQNIVSIAAGNEAFSTLVTALKAADLAEVLQGEGPFTVFAPTNEAFSKVPEETLNELLKPENKKQLQGVLTYHVVSGKVDAATATTLSAADSVQGEQISLSYNGKTVMVNQANVISADIMASNGVIHVIDNVILPPSLTQSAEMDNINTLMEKEPTAAGNQESKWDENLRILKGWSI
ncbi:fasciclin domain-containing protein [Neptuniibacter sp.]|uniref:fasciclin domain-containing protein n=1 Tax=Neptuniibacter sp. TaxID=1962643 RepID=UPI002626CB51|nr:fasciclin domain-containing protein [Neptuniibacter sp.]MCP4596120.1 fasciclin domain-containing protein [Neptuniibacter sp.]